MALFYDFRVDVSADKVLDSGFHFTQGDSRQIFFRIVVMDGSKKFEPEGAERITINFRKADGTVVEGIPEYINGVYQYQLLGNELQYPGRVIGDVKFEYDSGRISTGMFSFIVDLDTTNANAVKSTSYLTTLEEARQEARNIIGEINTSKDSIKGYSDSAVEASESARMAANDSRQYASGDNETSAKHYAEQAEETLEELKEYSNDFTYLFVMYSPNHDGADATDTPDDNTRYMGIYVGQNKIKPTNPSDYTWSRIRGADGMGSSWEDVSSKPFFSVSDDFVVESDALKIAYSLKAKIDSIDDKIDEPTNAHEGQALMFNSSGLWVPGDLPSNDWESVGNKPFEELGDDFASNDNKLELSDEFKNKYATKGNSLEHYGINDAYTQQETSELIDSKLVIAEQEFSAKTLYVYVYDTSKTYLKDDMVTYQGAIYRFTEASEPSTSFPYGKCEMLQLKDISESKYDLKSDYYNPDHDYVKGELCIYNNKVYKAIVDTVPAGALPTSNNFKETTLREELKVASAIGLTEASVWVSTIPNVTKCGSLCILQMAYRIKAGTYKAFALDGSGSKLGKLPFVPTGNFNFLAMVGSALVGMRCADDGYLYFNNNQTLSSDTWITACCSYFTKE